MNTRQLKKAIRLEATGECVRIGNVEYSHWPQTSQHVEQVRVLVDGVLYRSRLVNKRWQAIEEISGTVAMEDTPKKWVVIRYQRYIDPALTGFTKRQESQCQTVCLQEELQQELDEIAELPRVISDSIKVLVPVLLRVMLDNPTYWVQWEGEPADNWDEIDFYDAATLMCQGGIPVIVSCSDPSDAHPNRYEAQITLIRKT